MTSRSLHLVLSELTLQLHNDSSMSQLSPHHRSVALMKQRLAGIFVFFVGLKMLKAAMTTCEEKRGEKPFKIGYKSFSYILWERSNV